MPKTLIDSLWVPEIWVEALAEKQAEFPVMMNSGSVVKNELFDEIANGAGETANIPTWADITGQDDEVQEEDTEPTGQAITAGKQIAPLLNRVTSNPASALSAQISGSEPADRIIQSLVARRLRQREKTVNSILNGLFNAGGALADLSDENAVEVIGSVGPGNMIDAAMILNATAALGERASDLETGAMFVHPVILAALKAQDQNNFERTSEGPFALTRWKGIPIFASNALVRAGTTSGFVYSTYLLAANSFAYGEADQIADDIGVASLQLDRDKAKNNWTIFDRTRFLVHPNGVKFVGAIAKQSASNAELADVAAWERAYTDLSTFGMVRLTSNG